MPPWSAHAKSPSAGGGLALGPVLPPHCSQGVRVPAPAAPGVVAAGIAAAVGLAIGLAVGLAVGLRVGLAVGLTVGLGVGVVAVDALGVGFGVVAMGLGVGLGVASGAADGRRQKLQSCERCMHTFVRWAGCVTMLQTVAQPLAWTPEPTSTAPHQQARLPQTVKQRSHPLT